MKKASQLHKSIGEVINYNEIVDLYTGKVYLNSSDSDSWKVSKGQIVGFSFEQDVPQNVTILASNDSAQAQLYKIAANKKLMPFFPTAIQAEVEQVLENPGIKDAELIDLEALAFCTIDGVDTMDLDQALHVEKTQGGYTVRYAIADAAYYIRPGSALFEEALNRGTSFYLPGLMIPMLPRALCVDVISLNENVARRAVIFEIHLNEKGHHLKTHIVRARIRSRGKLSFKEVNDFLNKPSALIRNDQQLSTCLSYFETVGLLRLKLAEERNIARFHRTEINVKLGKNGLVFNLLDNVRHKVELYNEQFSLLCNITGAKLLAEQDESLASFIQPIYKVHPAPTEEKLKAFETLVSQLIKAHGLKNTLWLWKRNEDETLSDYLRNLPKTGDESRIAQAIHRQALLINARSSFSEKPGRHYGVGADVYGRFSAPMREIVGVYLHKELMEKILGCETNCSDEQDVELRQQVILAANRAKGIQRQLTNEANLLVLDQIFSIDFTSAKENVPIRKGTVLSLGRDKLYILLDEISIEIKLYIQPLAQLWKIPLLIDNERLALINRNNQEKIIGLGDEVEIFVVDNDIARHRWIFSIVRPKKG